MKTHLRWIVAAMMLMTVILAGCNPLEVAEKIGATEQEQPAQQQAEEEQEEGQATPTAQADPTATPKAAAEPAAEAEEEEEVVVNDLDELEGVTSYRSQMVTEMNDDGEVTTSDILIEYSAEGPALRTVVSSNDMEETWEMIRIGDTTYMRGTDGEWFVMQAEGQEERAAMTGIFQWEDTEDVLNDDGCDYKGKETIEGQETRHYHCDDRVFQGQAALSEDMALSSAYMDYYISTDLMIAVKAVIFWEGTSEGAPFSYKMESLVTDVNAPITIEAPEGVEAPGAGEDVPVMDGAEEATSFMGMVSYKVALPLADVAAWYESEMPANGWELDAESGMTSDEMVSQNWKKDTRTATLMLSADGESTSVMISTQTE